MDHQLTVSPYFHADTDIKLCTSVNSRAGHCVTAARQATVAPPIGLRYLGAAPPKLERAMNSLAQLFRFAIGRRPRGGGTCTAQIRVAFCAFGCLPVWLTRGDDDAIRLLPRPLIIAARSVQHSQRNCTCHIIIKTHYRELHPWMTHGELPWNEACRHSNRCFPQPLQLLLCFGDLDLYDCSPICDIIPNRCVGTSFFRWLLRMRSYSTSSQKQQSFCTELESVRFDCCSPWFIPFWTVLRKRMTPLAIDSIGDGSVTGSVDMLYSEVLRSNVYEMWQSQKYTWNTFKQKISQSN